MKSTLLSIAIAAFGLAALSPLLACSPSSSTEPTGTASKVPTVVLPAAYCVPLVEPDAATGEAGSIVAQAGLQVIAKAGDKVVAVTGSFVWAEKGSHVMLVKARLSLLIMVRQSRPTQAQRSMPTTARWLPLNLALTLLLRAQIW